jgi:hypothetical protein
MAFQVGIAAEAREEGRSEFNLGREVRVFTGFGVVTALPPQKEVVARATVGRERRPERGTPSCCRPAAMLISAIVLLCSLSSTGAKNFVFYQPDEMRALA